MCSRHSATLNRVAPVNAPNKPEPGLYRAEQLQRVLVQDGKPVENQLSAADADALNDPAAREYTPWRAVTLHSSFRN